MAADKVLELACLRQHVGTRAMESATLIEGIGEPAAIPAPEEQFEAASKSK